ncbi:Glycogen debranching enzyme (alpha-1,6-glucosidase) [Micromonospora matsumotoense]|uniref:Glycogen debranching enzyme (Alpha-1,6-glucosidase) n=1 Tax=Micromonospora matsumotoense TaxID=121616 RepID=A0A1C4UU21_9ACTN|nr:glycogen debranching N-terminal domain-containing protein [Micromonospora matsumotoense]SCE75159.1 Glycogen debranching enzyme (alpha-1,6-glucosidase) [Micromonospora matsumotoense]
MDGRIAEFFADLAANGRGRLPAAPIGLLRFEVSVEDGETAVWFVQLADGHSQVSRTGDDPDCTVEVRPEAFARLLAGRDNLVAMLLRGDVSVAGDLALLFTFRRLLPVDADSTGAGSAAEMVRHTAPSFIGLHEVTSVFSGNIFMISAQNGDVLSAPTTPLGLFSFDTRFLSTWRLTVNAESLSVLSVDDVATYEAKFGLVPGEPTHYVNATTSVLRHRWVGPEFEEEIVLFNYAPEPVRYVVRLEVGADFAEVLEVRDGFHRARPVTATIADDALRLHYKRGSLHRETVITSSTPAELDEHGLTWTFTVVPHGTWSTRLRVLALLRDLRRRDLRERLTSSVGRGQHQRGRDIAARTAGVPRLRTDHKPLQQAYEYGIRDLAALHYPGLNFQAALPATGLPWSMALLGRESLVSSFQALPFMPERTVNTLRILALSQGVRQDPFRGEQPGKIVQESRYGDSGAFNDTPEAANFSAVDTTALFVILLDEYERWTGDAELVRRFEFEARAAIGWLDSDADPTGSGYVWSTRHPTRTGPQNESWRNSADAICFADGRPPTFPLAICEIQGYAYEARRRAARMARRFWGDPGWAGQRERDAARLREQFDRDFWLPEHGHYAVAVQLDGTPLDSLTSNMGQLLCTGIVAAHRAEQVVAHLFSPALYSGWGIRTLASTAADYNPLGHHTGAVWPWENSLIAWGLRRAGFRAQAARIATGLLDAARHFQGRLPAYLTGYDRATTHVPVPHGFTDSPYAPSAGAPLLLLRTLLGLEPYEDHLAVDAAMPEELGQIELLDIRGRWGYADALGRGRPFRDRPTP